jgi:hypothetical protein
MGDVISSTEQQISAQKKSGGVTATGEKLDA